MAENPTLEALQRLSDGRFHRLADEVLRHLNPTEFSQLKPNGINEEDRATKGHPDSYVGPSPEDCVIAVEHTVTAHKGLKAKFNDDLGKIAKACKKAKKIVLCASRPEKIGIADEVRKKAKSTGKWLEIVWGNDIARALDEDRQDLRKKYLGIPLEALHRHSLTPALRARAEQAVRAHLGAEGTRALRNRLRRRPLETQFNKRRTTRRSGITLVDGPAGQGKTIWSCATALQVAQQNPVVWTRARHIEHTKDGVAAAIVTAAYGSNEPAKAFELATLLRASDRYLVAFIDAIDESDDYQDLQERLDHFRTHSTLSARTHIVLSCRTEAIALFEATNPDVLPQRGGSEQSRLQVPRFQDQESATLLSRLGATKDEIANLKHALPTDFYATPLYLKLARKLQESGQLPTGSTTWVERFAQHYIDDITNRLRADGKAPSNKAIRNTLEQLSLAALSDPQGAEPDTIQGTLIEPTTTGEATFVERAIQSGLIVRSNSRVHFCHALLCEYFAAAHIANDPSTSPADKVRRITSLPGQASIARLAAEKDPILLTELASQAPQLIDTFTPGALTNESIEGLLTRAEQLLRSNYPSYRHAAARILGTVRSQRAKKIAVDWFNALPQDQKTRHIHESAEIFLRLEVIGAVSIAALHDRFRMDRHWYDANFATRLEQLSQAFRQALAEHAVQGLDQAEAGSSEEARFTLVLGYLRDPRLLKHLQEKAQVGPLTVYDHRALIHINTDEAMQVYLQSRDHYYSQLDSVDAEQDRNGSIRAGIWHELVPKQQDIIHFPHDALLRTVQQELVEDGRGRRFALAFADTLQNQDLISEYAEAVAERRKQGYPPGDDRMIDQLVEGMSDDEIIRHYNTLTSTEAKKTILRIAGEIPSPELERLLLSALADEELFSSAVVGLTAQRTYQAGPILHERLKGAGGGLRHVLVKALGRIRYEPALADLIKLLGAVPAKYDRDDHDSSSEEDALVGAIGSIGSKQAVDALVARFRARPAERIMAYLLDSHDEYALRAVHELLSEHPGTKGMVGQALAAREFLHDDRVIYHDDATIPEFTDEKILDALLESARKNLDDDDARGGLRVLHEAKAIALFDSPKAAAFLDELASRDEDAGSQDPRVGVRFARHTLAQRGEKRWIEDEIETELRFVAVRSLLYSKDIERLKQWPAELVREVLRKKIDAEPAKLGAWLYLLVGFATSEDQELLRDNLDKVPASIADIILQKLPVPTDGE